MRFLNVALILVLIVGVLTGCGGNASSNAAQEGASAAAGTPESYTSAVLVTTYPDALPASSQLALGTLRLEGTQDAVTPAQAKTLLPLWKAIQGGSLKTDAETNTVVKQIEGAMTPEQLAAIAAMQLTTAGLQTWAQEQGVSLAPPPDATGAPGGFAPPASMSEGEGAAMQATRQAGGQGGFPPGGMADMSEEERAAMRATVEASGMTSPGRGPAGGGRGQLSMMAEPVVELLTQRAAE
jgi:hypothetical protein